jgi:hypothetical protein
MDATCPVPLPGFGAWYHDWRLWKREPVVPTAEHVTADEYHFIETWYCTRCREFETRVV